MINRRKFIKNSGLAGGGLLLSGCQTPGVGKRKQPNIIFIITDQQSATMLSCTGNKWVKTPGMDSLMKKGMRFEKAYSTNPVCLPARFGFMTGHYPSAVEVRHNGQGRNAVGIEKFLDNTLGKVFRNAGYETVYGGKVHLPRIMSQIENCGFTNLTRDERGELADKCVDYLKQKHDKPFLMVTSLINPHDICYMAITDTRLGIKRDKFENIDDRIMYEHSQMPEGISKEKFLGEMCPPVPANYNATQPPIKTMDYIFDQRPFKARARDTWGEDDWKLHRWCYARLTEKVDGQITRVLDALRQAGLEDDTIVVLTSDHGDMDSAHRFEHKSHTYEEAARIPLFVQYPGITRAGHVDRKNLVSNGLDIMPTLCDLADIKPPEGLPGRSLRPLLDGKKVNGWRNMLMIETEFGWGITDGRYKYTRFDQVVDEELLCDLQKDPGEMHNAAGNPAYAEVLEMMRQGLKQEMEKHGCKMRNVQPA